MSSKDAMPKEIGVIGHMYEDRKTKRKGVLESRNEKYKTLLFRDENGGSFTIVYSTFRSNWRKYTGEEVIQTSTQVEEQKVEEQKVEEKVTKAKKRSEEAVALADKNAVVDSALAYIKASAEKSGITLDIKVTKRLGVMLKANKRKYAEVWFRDKFTAYSVCTNLTLGNIKGVTHIRKDDWTMKNLYRSDSLDNMIDAVITKIKAELEKEAEKSKKEEK